MSLTATIKYYANDAARSSNSLQNLFYFILNCADCLTDATKRREGLVKVTAAVVWSLVSRLSCDRSRDPFRAMCWRQSVWIHHPQQKYRLTSNDTWHRRITSKAVRERMNDTAFPTQLDVCGFFFLNKLCYCRGTARRATRLSVEILQLRIIPFEKMTLKYMHTSHRNCCF